MSHTWPLPWSGRGREGQRPALTMGARSLGGALLYLGTRSSWGWGIACRGGVEWAWGGRQGLASEKPIQDSKSAGVGRPAQASRPFKPPSL